MELVVVATRVRGFQRWENDGGSKLGRLSHGERGCTWRYCEGEREDASEGEC